jgi:lipopolysaccharide assembly outer membrane protein LptD (OstA)
LSGNVVVTSKDYKSTITCDKLVWDGNRNLIHALGNVRFKSRQYTAEVFDELLASPKMNQIGTPDLFYKVNRD